MLGAEVPTCGPGSAILGAVWRIGARATGPGSRGAPPGIAAGRGMAGPRGTEGVARADGVLAVVARGMAGARGMTGRASGAARGTRTLDARAAGARGTAGVRTVGARAGLREGVARAAFGAVDETRGVAAMFNQAPYAAVATQAPARFW